MHILYCPALYGHYSICSCTYILLNILRRERETIELTIASVIPPDESDPENSLGLEGLMVRLARLPSSDVGLMDLEDSVWLGERSLPSSEAPVILSKSAFPILLLLPLFAPPVFLRLTPCRACEGESMSGGEMLVLDSLLE